MKLTKKLKQAILNHANQEKPRECCGFIVSNAYVPCRNISTDYGCFEIDPKDTVKAERLGEIQAIVHSHPQGTSEALPMDIIQMSHHKKPWVIVGSDGEFSIYENY
ncbi:conserved hypothetical protein [Moraxellaceae bacterium 17A]|nr:conserved hypothetical protein [Moraxellaceae bacterium 17A]